MKAKKPRAAPWGATTTSAAENKSIEADKECYIKKKNGEKKR
jgi:hypothetical protein